MMKGLLQHKALNIFLSVFLFSSLIAGVLAVTNTESVLNFSKANFGSGPTGTSSKPQTETTSSKGGKDNAKNREKTSSALKTATSTSNTSTTGATGKTDKDTTNTTGSMEGCGGGLSTAACFCTTTNCYWNDTKGNTYQVSKDKKGTITHAIELLGATEKNAQISYKDQSGNSIPLTNQVVDTVNQKPDLNNVGFNYLYDTNPSQTQQYANTPQATQYTNPAYLDCLSGGSSPAECNPLNKEVYNQVDSLSGSENSGGWIANTRQPINSSTNSFSGSENAGGLTANTSYSYTPKYQALNTDEGKMQFMQNVAPAPVTKPQGMNLDPKPINTQTTNTALAPLRTISGHTAGFATNQIQNSSFTGVISPFANTLSQSASLIESNPLLNSNPIFGSLPAILNMGSFILNQEATSLDVITNYPYMNAAEAFNIPTTQKSVTVGGHTLTFTVGENIGYNATTFNSLGKLLTPEFAALNAVLLGAPEAARQAAVNYGATYANPNSTTLQKLTSASQAGVAGVLLASGMVNKFVNPSQAIIEMNQNIGGAALWVYGKLKNQIPTVTTESLELASSNTFEVFTDARSGQQFKIYDDGIIEPITAEEVTSGIVSTKTNISEVFQSAKQEVSTPLTTINETISLSPYSYSGRAPLASYKNQLINWVQNMGVRVNFSSTPYYSPLINNYAAGTATAIGSGEISFYPTPGYNAWENLTTDTVLHEINHAVAANGQVDPSVISNEYRSAQFYLNECLNCAKTVMDLTKRGYSADYIADEVAYYYQNEGSFFKEMATLGLDNPIVSRLARQFNLSSYQIHQVLNQQARTNNITLPTTISTARPRQTGYTNDQTVIPQAKPANTSDIVANAQLNIVKAVNNNFPDIPKLNIQNSQITGELGLENDNVGSSARVFTSNIDISGKQTKVAIKVYRPEVVANFVNRATEQGEYLLPENVFSRELENTKLISDLEIGPHLYGVNYFEDGSTGIVTDVIYGTFPDETPITAFNQNTVNDLIKVHRSFTKAGNYQTDLQYLVTEDGYAIVIDAGGIVPSSQLDLASNANGYLIEADAIKRVINKKVSYPQALNEARASFNNPITRITKFYLPETLQKIKDALGSANTSTTQLEQPSSVVLGSGPAQWFDNWTQKYIPEAVEGNATPKLIVKGVTNWAKDIIPHELSTITAGQVNINGITNSISNAGVMGSIKYQIQSTRYRLLAKRDVKLSIQRETEFRFFLSEDKSEKSNYINKLKRDGWYKIMEDYAYQMEAHVVQEEIISDELSSILLYIDRNYPSLQEAKNFFPILYSQGISSSNSVVVNFLSPLNPEAAKDKSDLKNDYINTLTIYTNPENLSQIKESLSLENNREAFEFFIEIYRSLNYQDVDMMPQFVQNPNVILDGLNKLPPLPVLESDIKEGMLKHYIEKTLTGTEFNSYADLVRSFIERYNDFWITPYLSNADEGILRITYGDAIIDELLKNSSIEKLKEYFVIAPPTYMKYHSDFPNYEFVKNAIEYLTKFGEYPLETGFIEYYLSFTPAERALITNTKALLNSHAIKQSDTFVKSATKRDWIEVFGEESVNNLLSAMPKQEARNAFTHNDYDRASRFFLELTQNFNLYDFNLNPLSIDISTNYIKTYGFSTTPTIYKLFKTAYINGHSQEELAATIKGVVIHSTNTDPYIPDPFDITPLEMEVLAAITNQSVHIWTRLDISSLINNIYYGNENGLITSLNPSYKPSSIDVSLQEKVLVDIPESTRFKFNIISSEIAETAVSYENTTFEKTQLIATLKQKLDDLETSLDPNSKSFDFVTKQIAETKQLIETLSPLENIDDIVGVLSEVNIKAFGRYEADLTSIVRRLALKKMFNVYGNHSGVVDNAAILTPGVINLESLNQVVNIIDVYLKLNVVDYEGAGASFWSPEVLAKLIANKKRFNIYKFFNDYSEEFKPVIASAETIDLNQKAKVELIPDKGLIGEMSGYLGGACYTKCVPLLQNYPNLTPFKFVLSYPSTGERTLIGSSLSFEIPTQEGGTAILIRAFNIRVSNGVDTSLVFEKFADLLAQTAKKRGISKVLVAGTPGTTSNYDIITNYVINKYVSGKQNVPIDGVFDFNDHDISSQIYLVREVK